MGVNMLKYIKDAWNEGKIGEWIRTGEQDSFGRDLWVWDKSEKRKKGWWKNGWEATSQFFNAWFLNGHANLTTSAMAGSWQKAKIKIRGTIWPKFINYFMWFFTLSWVYGKPVDKNHCLDAWRDKV